MPTYNKLVRDKIPQVIAATGATFRTMVLSEVDYHRELNRKLHEELEEFLAAKSPQESLEEMADMLEVIRALATMHGATWEQLESIRAAKADKRGGFEERVYLIDADDPA
ncbi:nucleoside triphosphate pyrophosphohydrolase [Paenibacillus methanolicus]|uniref:Putative house-cleaning noncanonical NTP pyrophosphatase (MazG superfamily) n=1 Tax=Paenibacillus methanolicus TaxID=582686 RepID=A0A5S5BR02_9BACL|nr:nucleoside triphosphate pyrophosphohydrolase [Paenibacillus methanolicus]TYP69635.1 putative house-cleaning noncanonical NTP pyrophosphatase (MazG superfamily) [Paenibacillus methanolicus]